jgi:hypothetical protein
MIVFFFALKSSKFSTWQSFIENVFAFASTILLFNDVPMEIVYELLGHSSMLTTQESYTKVIQRKVSDEMKKLKNKIA